MFRFVSIVFCIGNFNAFTTRTTRIRTENDRFQTNFLQISINQLNLELQRIVYAMPIFETFVFFHKVKLQNMQEKLSVIKFIYTIIAKLIQ